MTAFTIVHIGAIPGQCMHCGGEFFRPTDPDEPWVDADHCRCGRNDDGQPKVYLEDGDDAA